MTTGSIEINGANPYIKLTGTEGSNDPCGIREKAGNFEVYDVSDDGAALTVSVADGNVTTTGNTVVGGGLTVTTAKTDGQMQVSLTDAKALSGTWTLSEASTVLKLTRTAATATHEVVFPVYLPKRTTALKGIKPLSLVASYTTTGGVSGDSIYFSLQKQTVPADGSGATGSVLAGDDNADYDTGHDTLSERYGAGSHTVTVTIPTGEQAFLADGEQLYIKATVTDGASADLTFVVTGLVLNYTVAAY